MRRANDNETSQERFKRIATLRTNAILDKLRILGKLSNRQRYSYSEEDINKIFSAINKQVREVRAKFDSQKEKKFKL
jgi:ABC-type Fe3+-hydroxamate transport system substrate-binding protein